VGLVLVLLVFLVFLVFVVVVVGTWFPVDREVVGVEVAEERSCPVDRRATPRVSARELLGG
jgi:hypothetical protein